MAPQNRCFLSALQRGHHLAGRAAGIPGVPVSGRNATLTVEQGQRGDDDGPVSDPADMTFLRPASSPLDCCEA